MGAIALRERKDFISKIKGLGYRGSAGSYFLVEGELYSTNQKFSSFDRVCYGNIRSYYKSVSELFVFHLPIAGMSEHWTNYVLNKGIYKDAFHTKSLERGYKYGFRINCNLPSNVVLGAIITLRETFSKEYSMVFNHGIKAGISEEDMIYAMSRINLYEHCGESVMYVRDWDSDHNAISIGTTYKDFVKGPVREWKDGIPVKIAYSPHNHRMVVENYTRQRSITEQVAEMKKFYSSRGTIVTEESVVELVKRVKEVLA